MSAELAVAAQKAGLESLTVLLVGPDCERRRTLTNRLERFSVNVKSVFDGYPNVSEIAGLCDEECDGLIIDIDDDSNTALNLIENLCSRNPSLTGIVYTSRTDHDLFVDCMRVGVRELVREPLTDDALSSIIVRMAARRSSLDRRRPTAKKFVFWGVKGGAGSSTLAAHFAVALAGETRQKVALLDLNVDLGDLALLLNLSPKFTILDALNNSGRLDSDFLAGLMTEHKSGVHLLAAPDRLVDSGALQDSGAVMQVLSLLEEQYPWVVLDSSPGRCLPLEALSGAESVFLVAQGDIPSVRNTQRIIAHLAEKPHGLQNVQVVLNRFESRKAEITLQQISRAIEFPVSWHIPNDYSAVRNAVNTGASTFLDRSPVGSKLREMARKACSKAEPKSQKSLWKLFR